MTDRQLFAIYGVERTEGGWPKFAGYDDIAITPESVYREWLKLAAGINDLTVQLKLWAEERKRRVELAKECGNGD